MQKQMKSFTWLILAILSFFALSLSAQNTPTTYPRQLAAPTGPIASIEFGQTTYDFGIVEEGKTVSQVFTFTNTSDQPLILTNARGSCGCTVPKWPREPISPGETASLTVEFNSKNKRGKRNQKVTLSANTQPPQTFIYLKGEVIPRDESKTNTSGIKGDKPEEEANPDCFAIYPSPSSETLKLEMAESSLGQAATISIFSQAGQLMAKREVKAISGTIVFDVTHYPAGTYVANVQIKGGTMEARCFVVVD